VGGGELQAVELGDDPHGLVGVSAGVLHGQRDDEDHDDHEYGYGWVHDGSRF
jgi:hypothetical protein